MIVWYGRDMYIDIKLIYLSKLGMVNAHIHRFVLHMSLEYAIFVVTSLVLAHTVQRFRTLIRPDLGSHRRCGVVGLV